MLEFYEKNAFAERLVCQFLCGKEKLLSCIFHVIYLTHILRTCSPCLACVIAPLKASFSVKKKCLLYHSSNCIRVNEA